MVRIKWIDFDPLTFSIMTLPFASFPRKREPSAQLIPPRSPGCRFRGHDDGSFSRLSASQSYLVAPSLGYSAQALLFRLEFFSLNQLLVRLGDQILRADFFDRRDFVV